jgi:hypothetical protein
LINRQLTAFKRDDMLIEPIKTTIVLKNQGIIIVIIIIGLAR